MGFARHIGIMVFGFFWALNAQGRFVFPTNLTASERQTTVDVFGAGTAPKFLSNAFPLGGFEGLEVSVSLETFSVKKIEDLRPQEPNAGSVYFPKVTVAKGLYNHSDLFFNFTPFNQSTRISRYGAQYRWSFFRPQSLPLNLSLLLSGNATNIDNNVTLRTLSSDLVAGMRWGNFSLLLSGGFVTSTGSFSKSMTAEGDKPQRSTTKTARASLGFLYQPGRFLAGVSFDFHQDLVTTGKLGVNF